MQHLRGFSLTYLSAMLARTTSCSPSIPGSPCRRRGDRSRILPALPAQFVRTLADDYLSCTWRAWAMGTSAVGVDLRWRSSHSEEVSHSDRLSATVCNGRGDT